MPSSAWPRTIRRWSAAKREESCLVGAWLWTVRSKRPHPIPRVGPTDKQSYPSFSVSLSPSRRFRFRRNGTTTTTRRRRRRRLCVALVALVLMVDTLPRNWRFPTWSMPRIDHWSTRWRNVRAIRRSWQCLVEGPTTEWSLP